MMIKQRTVKVLMSSNRVPDKVAEGLVTRLPSTITVDITAGGLAVNATFFREHIDDRIEGLALIAVA